MGEEVEAGLLGPREEEETQEEGTALFEREREREREQDVDRELLDPMVTSATGILQT